MEEVRYGTDNFGLTMRTHSKDERMVEVMEELIEFLTLIILLHRRRLRSILVIF